MTDSDDLGGRFDSVARDQSPIPQSLRNGVGDGDFGSGLGDVDPIGFGRLSDSETIIGERGVSCVSSGLNEAASSIV